MVSHYKINFQKENSLLSIVVLISTSTSKIKIKFLMRMKTIKMMMKTMKTMRMLMTKTKTKATKTLTKTIVTNPHINKRKKVLLHSYLIKLPNNRLHLKRKPKSEQIINI